MTVAFRTARAEDIELILAMMRRFYALDAYPFDEVQARGVVLALIKDAAYGRIWLIEAAGACIGYVVLTLGYSLEYLGRDAFVDELYLEPEHRGKGVGTSALQCVEAECRRLGIRALHLEVERTNHAAQALYRKWAFQDQDRLLMTKHLSDTRGT